MFDHVGRCPVCGAILDTIVTPTRELSGLVTALLLQPAREAHAAESPTCVVSPAWSRGWTIDPPVENGKVEVPVAGDETRRLP